MEFFKLNTFFLFLIFHLYFFFGKKWWKSLLFLFISNQGGCFVWDSHNWIIITNFLDLTFFHNFLYKKTEFYGWCYGNDSKESFFSILFFCQMTNIKREVSNKFLNLFKKIRWEILTIKIVILLWISLYYISSRRRNKKKFYPKFGKKILKNQISQRSSWNFHGHPKKFVTKHDFFFKFIFLKGPFVMISPGSILGCGTSWHYF